MLASDRFLIFLILYNNPYVVRRDNTLGIDATERPMYRLWSATKLVYVQEQAAIILGIINSTLVVNKIRTS